MKKSVFAIILLTCGIAAAQNWTTVTATNITDLNQQKLAAGQMCFLATDQNDNPISVGIGGGGQALKRGYCSAVAAGAVTSFTVPNPANTLPTGVYYRVTVKDSSSGQEMLRYPQVSFTGAVFSFDNYAPLGLGTPAPLSGNSVTGSLSVTGNVSATGAVTGSNLPAGTVVSGTGTTNRITKFTNGASGIIGDSGLSDDGTTVSTSENVTVGGTGNFSNLEGILFANRYGNGTTTGIAGAITAAGSTTKTPIWVPGNYAITENVPGAIPLFLTGGSGASTSANISIQDFRYGDAQTAMDPTGNTAPAPNYRPWHQWNANYFRPFGSTRFMNAVPFNLNLNAWDGGVNINQNAYSDKTNWNNLDIRQFGYTPGQKVGLQSWISNYSTGDTLPLYGISFCYGGFTAGGDESCKAIDAESYQGNAEYTGTIAVTSTGATSITVAPTTASGTQGAGRFLYDQTTGTSSAGTISAITFTNANTPVAITGSGTSFGASTVNTTSSTAVTTLGLKTITPVSMAGISNGTVLVCADPRNYEKVVASNVTGSTFDATFRYPHSSGFIIAAGGAAGKYIALTADNATPATFGSTSQVNGAAGGSNGNVVNTLRYLIPIVRSTSNTAADIWLSSPNLGYISYTGRWTVAGVNTYTIFQGAEATSVQQNGTVSNTLTLEPNSATWTSGDTVAMALHYSINVTYGTFLANKFFPSSQGAQPGLMDYELFGLWTNIDNLISMINNAPASLYTTGGGVLAPPNGIVTAGPWASLWIANTAPISWLVSNDATHAVNIFLGAIAGDQFSYNPTSRLFSIGNTGTGNKIQFDPQTGNISPSVSGGADAGTASLPFNNARANHVIAATDLKIASGTALTGQTGTGTSIVTNTGPAFSSPTINTGVANNGTGLQHKRVASCTTAASANAACATTVTWNSAFADASYTAVCTINAPSAFVQGAGNQLAASMSITIMNNPGSSSAASGTLECIGVHD